PGRLGRAWSIASIHRRRPCRCCAGPTAGPVPTGCLLRTQHGGILLVHASTLWDPKSLSPTFDRSRPRRRQDAQHDRETIGIGHEQRSELRVLRGSVATAAAAQHTEPTPNGEVLLIPRRISSCCLLCFNVARCVRTGGESPNLGGSGLENWLLRRRVPIGQR